MYLLRQNVEQIKDLLENNIEMNKKYLTQLASEKEKLAFKTEKVELSMLDDILKLRDKATAKSKSAVKNVMGALSDLADTTEALEKGLKIATEIVSRGKDIGADDIVKRGQKIKSDFERVLDKHRKAITELRNVKGNI